MAIAHVATQGSFENPLVGTIDVTLDVGSGSDRMLLAFGADNRSGSNTGMTYNGVAMTQIGTNYTVTGNVRLYLYALVNPSSGSNTLQVTHGAGSSWAGVVGMAYTGVKQSLPTNFTTNQATTTSLSTSLSVAANSWLVVCGRASSTGDTNAGAGTTERYGTTGFVQTYDSNGPLSAGTQSLILTATSQLIGAFMVELEEATAASRKGAILAFF